jgi:hypothetical protein
MNKWVPVAFVLGTLCAGALAWAQSTPNFVAGYVPTAAQWNGYFAGKMDQPIAGLNITADALSSLNIGGQALASDTIAQLYKASPGSDVRFVLINQGTIANTQALIGAATGSANAYVLIAQNDGSSPNVDIFAGPGDSGGILVDASQAGSGEPLILKSGSATPVQFASAAAFDSNAAHCGSLAGSTGCFVWVDSTNTTRKTPAF